MATKLIVSVSPHLRDRESTVKVMRSVCLALLPAALASVYIFGLRAALVIGVSIAASLLTELVSERIFKRESTIGDMSAVVTGTLFAFTLPPQLPLWMVALGAVLAIFLVKQLFGGIGYNIFNPALAARAVLLSSFGTAMTTWAKPILSLTGMDAVSGPSVLGIAREAARSGVAANMPYGYMDLLTGTVPGSLGETCKIALLLGAAFLLIRGIVNWRIPVTFIGTMALLSFVVGKDPLWEVLSGGLILGAFFMATDYVTSPTTGNGRLIFGTGCGIVTFLIRNYGGYPEGVCYSILFMNCMTPLIELYVRPRRFGAGRAAAGGAG
jgi:Na+-translocating ferredoxin:NAD+ oxidoreductase subunit D